MCGPLTLANLPPGFEFVINAVICTLRPLGEATRDAMERELAVNAFLAFEPRDALEALWAGQAVAISHAAMAAWREAGNADDPAQAERHQRTAIMLTRTGAQMVRLIESRRRRLSREAKEDKDQNPSHQTLAPMPTAAERSGDRTRRPAECANVAAAPVRTQSNPPSAGSPRHDPHTGSAATPRLGAVSPDRAPVGALTDRMDTGTDIRMPVPPADVFAMPRAPGLPAATAPRISRGSSRAELLGSAAPTALVTAMVMART